MNKIGNILTILILLMSVCFLSVSIMMGASHRNWKQEAAKYKEEAETYRRAADDAKGKSGLKDTLLARERDSRARQLAQLEARLQIAQADLRDREARLKVEQTSNADLLNKLELTNKRLAEQDVQVKNLNEDSRKLIADISDKVSKIQSLTNQKYELENKIYENKKLIESLAADNASNKRVMDKVGVTKDTPTDHIVPALDGVVVKVNKDNQLVGIGLGSDDGLRVGHEMDIYRKDRYIGKIRITSTDFNTSVGQVIRDFMQDLVREGDHVTSKL